MNTRQIESAVSEPGWWAKAATNVIRLVLLAFLICILFTARFPLETPVAEDGAAPTQNSRTVRDPGNIRLAQAG